MRIPGQNKQIIQVNAGDTQGQLWSTFNVNLTENSGRFRVSPRMLVTTATADDSDLTAPPVGFKFYNSNIYTVAGSKVHVNTAGSLKGSFSNDLLSGSPTNCSSDYSDIETFNGNLYVSANSTNLYKLATATWSTIVIGSSASIHLMTVYGDKLYFTSGGSIYSISTSDTPSSALITFLNPTENTITCMRSSSNRIWIGASNRGYGKGYVYEWDGAASQATKSYRLQAQGCLAIVIKDNVPWIMDSDGKLSYWNGGTFIEAAKLPLNRKYLVNSLRSTNDRWIHPNGMTLVNGKINILINNLVQDSAGSILENCPSGIWEYDEEHGLYHKSSLTYYRTTAGSVSDYGQTRLSRVGAIADMKKDDASSDANGQILCGATYYTDATTTTSGIFMDDFNDTVQKAGYFVTTKIDSASIQDSWQKLIVKYKKLLDSTDKVVVKYRTTEQAATEATITWTSTTTFTTTTDISSYAVGDEVEILQGKGGGMCSHISAVSSNAGTYTVTVDETHTGASSGTAKARFQKWIKMLDYAGNVITGQVNQFTDLSIGTPDVLTQLKVWMLFTGKDELFELNLINEQAIPIK